MHISTANSSEMQKDTTKFTDRNIQYTRSQLTH